MKWIDEHMNPVEVHVRHFSIITYGNFAPRFRLNVGPTETNFCFCAGMKGNHLMLRCNQPKRGLATPHADWWRLDRLPSWAEEAIHSSAIESSCGYLDLREVKRLREGHQAGKAGSFAFVDGRVDDAIVSMKNLFRRGNSVVARACSCSSWVKKR